jgi:asparagine synthase (glutamine-hydrolysing)
MGRLRTCAPTLRYSRSNRTTVFRYFAFVWEPSNANTNAAARLLVARLFSQSLAWQAAIDMPGLFVAYTPGAAFEKAVVLPDTRGAILGTIFPKPGDGDRVPPVRQCTSFGDLESRRLVSSAGRALIDEYWGNYVAILNSPGSRSTWILRGAASPLPCLVASVEGVTIYFSWMEAFAQLRLSSLSIDWLSVVRTLLGPQVSARTGLREVQELLPGTCHELGGHGRRELRYWDPVQISRDGPKLDWEASALELRRVTKACMSAWSSLCGDLLHCLSGGLDSSIVLGCLFDATSPPRVTCLTHYFKGGADSDERRFARLAAQLAGCELLEYERDCQCDLRRSSSPIRFESSPGLRILEVDRIEPDLAIDLRAGVIFRGHGGDELFSRHPQFALGDFIRMRGFRSGFSGLAMHVAAMEGLTVWDTLVRALLDALVPRRWNLAAVYCRDQEGHSLIRGEVLREVLRDRSFDLPFAPSTRRAPPGKLWQISMLCARRPYYGPFDTERDPPSLAPLLLKPIVELCLRTPTYYQVSGRRERALARAAFAPLLPPEIANRRCKGGAEKLAQEILLWNLGFVRECLFDGALAGERLIDIKRLEQALKQSPSNGYGTVPLFDLLGMELWLRNFSRPSAPKLETSAEYADVASHPGEKSVPMEMR